VGTECCLPQKPPQKHQLRKGINYLQAIKKAYERYLNILIRLREVMDLDCFKDFLQIHKFVVKKETSPINIRKSQSPFFPSLRTPLTRKSTKDTASLELQEERKIIGKKKPVRFLTKREIDPYETPVEKESKNPFDKSLNDKEKILQTCYRSSHHLKRIFGENRKVQKMLFQSIEMNAQFKEAEFKLDQLNSKLK